MSQQLRLGAHPVGEASAALVPYDRNARDELANRLSNDIQDQLEQHQVGSIVTFHFRSNERREWFFARAVATLDRQSRSIWLNIFEGDFSGRRIQFPSRIIEFAHMQIQEHIQASSIPDSIAILNKVQDISKQIIESHASQAAAAAASTIQSAQSSASMIMSAAASATSIQHDALIRVERRIEQEAQLLQDAKEALRLERVELQTKQDALNQESLALHEQYQQAKNDLADGQRLLAIKAAQLQQETGDARKALETDLAAKSRELRTLSERNLQDQKVKQAALDKRERQLLEEAAKLRQSDEELASQYAAKLQALEEQRVQLSATKKDLQQQQRDTQNALAEAQRLRDANAATAKELAHKTRTNQVSTATAGRKNKHPPRPVVIASMGKSMTMRMMMMMTFSTSMPMMPLTSLTMRASVQLAIAMVSCYDA